MYNILAVLNSLNTLTVSYHCLHVVGLAAFFVWVRAKQFGCQCHRGNSLSCRSSNKNIACSTATSLFLCWEKLFIIVNLFLEKEARCRKPIKLENCVLGYEFYIVLWA